MMKRFKNYAVILLMTLNFTMLYAQYDKGIKYQTVVRDGTGNVQANHFVQFKISILKSTATGTQVYQETQSMTTNNLGMANFNIGLGSNQVGSFSAISWGIDDYFLKIELDATGGGYVDMGTSQIMNVPRAFYADEVGKIGTDQVVDANIKDIFRNVCIPAGALINDPLMTNPKLVARGYRYSPTFMGGCTGIIAIPTDWDSVSAMTLEIYFTPVTSASANVDFFIRVIGRNPGDLLNDPGSSNGTSVPVSTSDILYKQTFTIPFYKIAGKEVLHIVAIQRGGPNDTYTGDVDMMMVKLVYKAKR